MQRTSPSSSSSVVIESNNRRHWSEGIRELVLSLSPSTTNSVIDDRSPFEISGGSENASFLLITNPRSERLAYLRGEERLTEGEILLELRGERVAGRTSYDVRRVLDDVRRNGGGPVSLKTIKPGFLQSSDLRAYLNLRFSKGSLDHDLQNTIRENVYSKTVPCTTRERREGELDGQEYRFISKAEFEALEASGQLLESGIYEGNYYGTPKPQAIAPDRSPNNEGGLLTLEPSPVEGGLESSGDCWPPTAGNRPPPPDQGHHHQRHREEDHEGGGCIMAPLFMTDANNKNIPATSNVMNNNNNNSISEGLAASTSLVDQQPSSTTTLHNNTLHYNNNNGPTTTTTEEFLEEDGLGPMPLNWEIGYTESGEKYFIDHNRGITQWTDPRLERRSPPQQPAAENTDATGAAISIGGEELLPAGWDRVEDPQYGVYYVDHVNKVTQYEKPTFPQQPAAADNGTILRRQYVKRTSSVGPRRVNSSNDLLVVAKCAQSPHKGLFTLNPRELRGEMISTSLVKGPKGLGFTLVGNDGNTTDDEFLQIRNIIAHGPAHKDGLLRTGDILVYVNGTCVLGYSQNDIVRIFQSISPGESVSLRVCRGYPLLFDPSSAGGDLVVTTQPAGDPLGLTRPETVLVKIVKGDMGFGFTIADSPYGQKVKKILDKPRCRGLMENDLLCVINGHNVRKMGHAEIVDVLKDCPVGVEAVLQVQRAFGTMKRSQTDISGIQKNPPTVPAKPAQRPHSYHPAYTNGNNDPDRRSKTPTAAQQQQHQEYSESSAVGPSVRPRSKTPGPAPNRPHKPNGLVTTNGGGGGNGHYPHYGPSGVPIYENLPRQQQQSPDGQAPLLAAPPRPKTPSCSSSSFASATPNYVPASVYCSNRNYDRPATVVGDRVDHQQNLALDHRRREEQGSGPPIVGGDQRYDYIPVNLIRQQTGFGFRVVGGTEGGTSPTVGQIVPGGAADKDGRLRMGDQMVQIDGLPMTHAAHQDAVRAMCAASQNGYVKLVVRRLISSSGNNDLPVSTPPPITTTAPAMSPVISSEYQSINKQRQPSSLAGDYHHHYQQQHNQQVAGGAAYPYDVTIVRDDSEGFGFQIVSSVYRSGSCIGKIIDGSPAARCGNLRVQDRIVKINGVNILRMHHGEIVNLIRDSGNVVTLTVGAPEDRPELSMVTASSVVPAPREMSAVERRRSLASVIETIERASPPNSETLEYKYGIVVSDPPSPYEEEIGGDSLLPPPLWPDHHHQHNLQEHLALAPDLVQALDKPNSTNPCFGVELQRGSKGFGFSIRGGQEFDNMPLLVLRIAEGGPAYLDGRLKVGDQLVEINGVSTAGMTHAEAIDLIKREPVVQLVVKRPQSSLADSPSAAADPDAMNDEESAYGRPQHYPPHQQSMLVGRPPSTTSPWPMVT